MSRRAIFFFFAVSFSRAVIPSRREGGVHWFRSPLASGRRWNCKMIGATASRQPAGQATPRAAEEASRPFGDHQAQREAEAISKIKARRYECFIEDHETKPWSAGRCAGYAGRGSLALHLYRCKRKDGHGIGSLFCKQHAKTGGY